jgi:hypothetical protein
MKKIGFLVLLFMILFILMWISWGLEYALVLFGTIIFIIVLVVLQIKWMIFVDKHVKD